MLLKQSTLDRIRVINKRFLNKILIHVAGKGMGHFAILTHTGRKSGRPYRIPIIAEPVEGGFVIALTYGRKVDWLRNVMAQGGCSLRWKNRDFTLVSPRLIDEKIGSQAFPAIFRTGLRGMGVTEYLRLEIGNR